MITIGIVMPVHNPRFDWMDMAVKSVIDQTERNWRMVVVDDGSDNHQEILDFVNKYNDKRISVEHKNRGGLGDALNFGFSVMDIKHPENDFETWISYDDFFYADHFQMLSTALLLDKDAGMAYGNTDYINNGNFISDEKWQSLYMTREYAPDKLVNKYYIGICWLWRSYLRKSIKPPFITGDCEIYDFQLKLEELSNYNFVHVDKPLGCYRQHDKQITAQIHPDREKKNTKVDTFFEGRKRSDVVIREIRDAARIRRGMK